VQQQSRAAAARRRRAARGGSARMMVRLPSLPAGLWASTARAALRALCSGASAGPACCARLSSGWRSLYAVMGLFTLLFSCVRAPEGVGFEESLLMQQLVLFCVLKKSCGNRLIEYNCDNDSSHQYHHKAKQPQQTSNSSGSDLFSCSPTEAPPLHDCCTICTPIP
jgi:hypothetical protein